MLHGKFWRSLGAAAAALAFAAFAAEAAPTKLSLATSQPGGGTFEIGTAFGKVISDNSGGKIDISTSITGGSTANIRVLDKKDPQQSFRMAMATSPAIYWAQNAQDVFKEKSGVLVLSALYPQQIVYATYKDSGIKQWKDLAGKRFAVGGRGGSIYIVTQNALKYTGIYDKVKRETFTNPQIVAGLQDKRIDAGMNFLNAYVPAPVYMELARTQEGKLHYFGPDEATLKQMEEKDPGVVRDVIPAGSLPGINYDIVSWAQMWALLAHRSMSNDIAYMVVKNMLDNWQQIEKYHPTGKHINPKNALRGMNRLTLHPGAARYYKEKGMLK
ncbi:MAG: TAXI family TRAP transporter solute-binding subunit [Candidatus Tectomicrobia bacterium]|uniref:TAXI family TRAP transporter solute-binding subunit n=1 Tax=Tectimicrobiota bacterium TaxID=2528274 RepID=A0A932MNV9_UNCTE|nr:TAXI family TRAP transporter solute-binding subunit [Candidatus Tectomicrobia bacterium]